MLSLSFISYATQNQFIQVRYADPLPLLWSLRTEGRVHRVVPDGKDDVPTPETGVPGVDLSAEERNGRWQILDEKRKNKTRDAEAVPGLIAEPTGTDGHRTIGRTWHTSLLTNSSLAEALCWSTRNTLPLPQPEKIRSPVPLTIRCSCLCPATFKLYLILAGRSRPRNGEPCSSVSSRGNRSVTSLVSAACRMRRSAVYCGPHVATKWDV